MKKVFIIVSIAFCATGYAQTKNTTDTIDVPAITEAGKPVGQVVEKKIGKEGGYLLSADGKIELKIPRDALKKNTVISILPITNMMPNGNGKAYRLEPSGIQFQKPVQLIFHYTNEELTNNAQMWQGISMQNHSGQWMGLRKFSIDTAAKTISGSIHHFSDWSKFDAIKLYPQTARVRVKKRLTLSIDLVSAEEEDLTTLGPQSDLSPLTKRSIPWTTTWRANEIIHGNNSVGTLNAGSKSVASYIAPAIVPGQNPVAITADLKGISYKYKGITFRDLKLVSNILVYDKAYEVSMTGEMTGSALDMHYRDAGSFVVSLESGKAEIIEKLNNNQLDATGYGAGTCRVVVLQTGTGLIHITGVRSIKVTPPTSPQGNPWIEIIFINAPVSVPLLEITCPSGRGSGTSTNAESRARFASLMPALPHEITFEAKEGEQTIIHLGKKGDPIHFKVTVKQLKDE